MKYKSSIENNFTNHSVRYLTIEAWVLQQEFFWIRDVRKQFPDEEYLVSDVINNLKKVGTIQCTDFKKSERQYVVIKNLKL